MSRCYRFDKVVRDFTLKLATSFCYLWMRFTAQASFSQIIITALLHLVLFAD